MRKLYENISQYGSRLNRYLSIPITQIVLAPLIIGTFLVLLQVALQSSNTPVPPATQTSASETSTPSYTLVSESTENSLATLPAILSSETQSLPLTEIYLSETSLSPRSTASLTGQLLLLTATADASLIQTHMSERWISGFGEIVDNVGKNEFGVQDITIAFSHIESRTLAGTMAWTARLPKEGLDGVGTRRDAVQIRGRYFTSITELQGIEYWNYIKDWDDDVVLWLQWQRTVTLEGEPKMSNVTLAVVTKDGQMRGAVYDPERDDALIFIFTIWPEN